MVYASSVTLSLSGLRNGFRVCGKDGLVAVFLYMAAIPIKEYHAVLLKIFMKVGGAGINELMSAPDF